MSLKSKLKTAALFLFLTLFLGSTPAPAGPQDAALTPVTVAPSVYMIKAFQHGDPQWSGTAWKAAEGQMITAGHVCDTDDEDGFTFRVYNKWNQSYPVKVIKFSRDPDLCLIDAKNIPGEPLNLTLIPHYGDPVWYVGAPLGIWGDGVAPMSKGWYLGGNKLMISGYPGVSGGPAFTEEGVFGVIVAGWRGTELMEFEPSWAVAEFMRAD